MPPPTIERLVGAKPNARPTAINRNNWVSIQDILDAINTYGRGQTKKEEVEDAVHDLRKKRHTTPEGINMRAFYLSYQYLKTIYITICRLSYHTLLIPEIARRTMGSIIPKKKKGEYRIVHISSCLSALLEIIALRRLEYALYASGLYERYQFGFCALTGRHELVSRIIELIHYNKLQHGRRASATIVNLDIEGAFDNVSQDILIDKLERSLVIEESLSVWLANFMLHRNIVIRYQNLESINRIVCKGVPQGSALGPILWNLSIHDIESQLSEPTQQEFLKYADDIMIVQIYRGYNTTIDQRLQNATDQLINRLASLKLNVNPQKCSLMRIGHNDTNNQRKLLINQQSVNQVREMTILGYPLPIN